MTTLDRRVLHFRGVRRTGMTLVEVIVAMLLLVSVILVLGGFSAKFAQATSQARLMVIANELASTRIDAVRQQPTYPAIDTLAVNSTTPKLDSVTADFTKFAVRTYVRRIGGAVLDSVDYKLVTVRINHQAMKKTVSKSTAVAAF